MNMRVTTLAVFSAIALAGVFVAAERLTVAPPPKAPLALAEVASAPVEPPPAPTAPQSPIAAQPAPITPPVAAVTPAPAVSAPPVAVAPAPPVIKIAPAAPPPEEATAPTPSPPKVASLPPVSAPPVEVKPAPAEPVVSVPALPPQKPAMTEKQKEEGVQAKFLFASKKLPTLGKAMAIGYYPHGCLQGGVELPVNGPNWQVMRVDRNRNWGHPELIHFLKKFAPLAAKATGWHGILIGDMAQPRGGPLPFGHMSHQIGLDVDIWFMPMPAHRMTTKERDTVSASYLVAPDGKHVNENWSPADAAFIRTAAEQPEVERVLVNAAIKKQLCEMEGKQHYKWMDKVRPWYGHADHIHVRLKCPADSPHCRKQPPVPGSDQCGKALDYWFADRILHPHPSTKPEKPRKGLTMADLPPACKDVLNAPARKTDLAGDSR